jgi:hypothetical protein
MACLKILAMVVILLGATSGIFAQSGGTFVIEKSVIAGGGGSAAGGSFVLEGTLGEPLAGRTSTGGVFEVSGGFWGGGNVPAASNATVSGRVFTSSGGSLRNAIVSIIDSTGVRRAVLTNQLGFYSFENVRTGESYTVAVTSKRYRFLTQTVSVNENLSDINFTGIE